MNPNYIGFCIIDWFNSSEYKIIKSGTYSLKIFNDKIIELNKLNNISSNDEKRKYINRKRNYEIVKIVQNIFKLFNYYKCNILSIEDLNIKSNDKNKGKDYNRLCNCNWIRTKFINQIIKLSNIYKIKLLKVKP